MKETRILIFQLGQAIAQDKLPRQGRGIRKAVEEGQEEGKGGFDLMRILILSRARKGEKSVQPGSQGDG